MNNTETNVPAQASDEPMRAAFEKWLISEAQKQHPVEPLTDKEKAFVLRRNVWDKESYEAHDGEWKGWQARASEGQAQTSAAVANLEASTPDVIQALKDALTLLSRNQLRRPWMGSDAAIVNAALGVIADYLAAQLADSTGGAA